MSRERERGAEHSMRLLVDSVRDCAIFMLDPHGYIATWNSGAERLKGYRAEEIIGQHLSKFYPPEDVAAGKCERELAEASANDRVEDEGWRVRKDGSRFWANVLISAVRDPEGNLLGFAKVTRDLTERRHAEEQLRLSEERFRLLIASVEDYAIFMLDPTGHVATWNAGARRIKGYEESEILGKHLSTFYTPEDAASGKAEMELEVATRDGRFAEEGWRVRKDGTRFWAGVVLTAVRDPSGQLLGFTKVTRDLTDRQEAEAQQLALAQADEAVRLRDEFLSIASHELKTPLTALQLQLESLRERVSGSDEKSAQKLDRVVGSTHRLTALVESLLDVSRIATGRFTLRRERLDISEIVCQTVEGFRSAAARAGCNLTARTSGPVLASFDRTRIEQIVMNLLSNAVKYGGGHPVEVSVEADGDSVAISVRDQGPGIAAEDLDRIFGRFERAASVRHYGGLGLGLYVTRQIAEAHGGSVSVVNLPDGGACFTVRLPKAAP